MILRQISIKCNFQMGENPKPEHQILKGIK